MMLSGVSQATLEADDVQIAIVNCPSKAFCKQRLVLGLVGGVQNINVKEDPNN